MSEIMQILEAAFTPLVFIFSVSNMFYMGLQVKMPEVIATLKNKKTLALILVWGWVLGPALALLIAWVLPLSEAFVIGLILYSLAPCAPFVPVMVGKARGDVSFAGALIPIVALATVVFMPLMGPLMIKGLMVSSWDLVKVLLIYILILRRVTFSEDDRNGGQLCPALHDNPHSRNRMDNVSIRFRPETESAQRHVAEYAHT
jgi:BASS family bile acid:Na+ symporter